MHTPLTTFFSITNKIPYFNNNAYKQNTLTIKYSDNAKSQAKKHKQLNLCTPSKYHQLTCGGSKLGRHQLPMVSSTTQSMAAPSCLPSVCRKAEFGLLKYSFLPIKTIMERVI